MKVMQSSEIPAFVDEVAATGCDITAVPGVGYIIGDADLPKEAYRKVEPELRRISQHYGERDHLLEEITAYLISIGRSYPRPARH
jgi:hypothetical protein